MLDKSYYKNMTPRNILNDELPKNTTSDNFSDLSDNSLENMIINSNLENSSIIK